MPHTESHVRCWRFKVPPVYEMMLTTKTSRTVTTLSAEQVLHHHLSRADHSLCKKGRVHFVVSVTRRGDPEIFHFVAEWLEFRHVMRRQMAFHSFAKGSLRQVMLIRWKVLAASVEAVYVSAAEAVDAVVVVAAICSLCR